MNLIPWAKPNLTKNDINKVKRLLIQDGYQEVQMSKDLKII